MNIYHYDKDGIFTHAGFADKSPLEDGVYLIPAFSTVIKPPESQNGFHQVFNKLNNSWVLSPVIQNPETGNDEVALTPEQELEMRKAVRASQVETIVVITSGGNSFDGNEDAQNRMARAIAGMDDDDSMPWVLSDNSIISVSKTELREALRLAGQRQAELWVIPYQ